VRLLKHSNKGVRGKKQKKKQTIKTEEEKFGAQGYSNRKKRATPTIQLPLTKRKKEERAQDKKSGSEEK